MEKTILQFIEVARSDLLTFFACVFSLFGETLFLVVAICLLYWLVDKKLGEKLIVTSFSSLSLNAFLKVGVSRPRPYKAGIVNRVNVDNFLISTTDLNAMQSFPSGHSQMSAGLFFGTACHYKKRWLWTLAPLMTLGVMLSRIYLGVHYPTDTLVGATMGIAFAFFWDFIYQRAESKKYWILGGFALVSFILCFFLPSKTTFEITGALIATSIALPIENKYICFENATGVKNRVLRAVIGLAIVLAVFLTFSVLPFEFLKWDIFKAVKYFCTILVAALVVPVIFKKMKI